MPLLTDSAPLVRREAVHALMMHGSQEASRLLLEALTSASGPARSALRKELTSTRDERAAPLFCHVVGHADPRAEPQLYLFAIEALGAIGGPDAVGSLKQALYRGDWRAPIRTRRARRTAARALQRIGTPDATHVLRQAAATGTMGVRAAARSQLASLP